MNNDKYSGPVNNPYAPSHSGTSVSNASDDMQIQRPSTPNNKPSGEHPGTGPNGHKNNWVPWFILCLAVVGVITISVVSSRSNSYEDFYADTLIDTEAFVDDSWIEDSINMAKRVTPDLIFFELHGPVKSSVVECDGRRHVYEFNQDGQLIMSDGEDPYIVDVYDGSDYSDRVKYTKDAQGRIVRREGWESVYEYTWDSEKPFMCKWWSEGFGGTISRVYDTRGFVIQKKETSYDQNDQSEYQSIENYEFTRIDVFGNWTECKGSDNQIVDRRIIYYPITRDY